MITEYKCEICGKVFKTLRARCGHQHVHADAHLEIVNRTKDKNQDIRLNKLTKWINEQHRCEHCGKIMTEKFGSGRFCSRACANSRIRTEESKKKTSQTLYNRYKDNKVAKIHTDNTISCNRYIFIENHRVNKSIYLAYLNNPKICPICENPIPYLKRDKKTCGKECSEILHSRSMNRVMKEKGLHENLRHRYKYGTYNGFHCDSSWELAFVLYHLDNNIPIQRCKEFFEYEYNNQSHLYFPDFIVNNTYYEIKGYQDETVFYKIEQFPKNKNLIILYKKQIQPYLKYARDTYGKDFITLYDRNYPSWMDNKLNDISTS